MLGIFNFLYESIEEVTHKVSWPSYEKVQELVNSFIIGLFVATLIIGLINIGFDKVTQWLYEYYK